MREEFIYLFIYFKVKCIQILEDMIKKCPQMTRTRGGNKSKSKKRRSSSCWRQRMHRKLEQISCNSNNFSLWIVYSVLSSGFLSCDPRTFPFQKYGYIAKVTQFRVQKYVPPEQDTTPQSSSKQHDYLSNACIF